MLKLSKEKIKSCPICGGKPVITDTAESRKICCFSAGDYDGEFVYHCCEVECSNYNKAVEIWNERA